MYSLIEMLRYKRPEGSLTQREFCKRFLEPTFGRPDDHGNYIHIVGDKPNLCFTSHHDTVHKTDGMQKLVVTNDVVSVANTKESNCLGADCTTGVWLMLGMIEEGVEGVYVVHAAEEVGCKGSRALITDYPEWLDQLDAVISFDRYGDKSVITHQMGMRTASDAFAKSFAEALNLPQLEADDGGSYTDSNEYSGIVSECTNISVGYYGQHGVNETQDLDFADTLLTALCLADWTQLVFKRDPSIVEDTWGYSSKYSNKVDEENVCQLEQLVIDYPHKIAELLDGYGYTAYGLMEDCDIDDVSAYSSYMDDYTARVSKKYFG